MMNRKFVWRPNGKYKVISETCKTPFKFIGGKHYIAKWIISHFPVYTCYVEPFGGGASVLLQKKPSKIEVYNDVDGHLCEFFEVLRDKPWELATLLTFMPYSRWLYDEWKRCAKAGCWPKNKVERVAMWFFLQRSSFDGQPFAGWSHSKKKERKSVPLAKIIVSLIEASNRLRSVQIENKDFREVIQIYDSPETLFYCDPPYLLERKRNDYYAHGFSMKDHENLAGLLNRVKGKVCLSYYSHPFVDQYYQNWRKDEKTVPCHSFGITKTKKVEHRPKRTELLLMNY